MKRIFLVFLVVAIAISSASAQPAKDAPKPAGTTRVAVINVGYVFNKYEKAIEFKHEIEGLLKGPKMEARRLLDQIEDYQDANSNETDAVKIKDNEEKIRTTKKQLEDLDTEIKRIIGKKQEDNLIVLWKGVQDGIRAYATKNGIQLVIGYGDPMDKEMRDLFPNVNRKMQAMDMGSMVPLFIGPGVEIDEGVTDLLNKRYRESKTKERKGADEEMK